MYNNNIAYIVRSFVRIAAARGRGRNEKVF